MGEPWLDSLSEDWKSEHQLSSPAASVLSHQQFGSVALNRSQSRIPHLAQSIRKDSSGPFLKHRSTRGLSRSRAEPILTERSASSLNVPPPHTGSQKRTTASTLPRRTSNAFSDSQNSVQHYSLRGSVNKAETPEWKKRLANGEDLVSDGLDLFAPSKLEGIFKGPTAKLEKENESSLLEGLSRPWESYKISTAPSVAEQYQSLRASRSRPPEMEVLPEEDEEELEHALSAISSEIVRDGSIIGMVHKRVQSLEKLEDRPQMSSPPHSRPSTASGLESADDPRWRTFSGRREIENEFISPITASRQNTIRDKALKESTEVDIEALDRKLAQIGVRDLHRPSSSSSDREVSYQQSKDEEEMDDNVPYVGDMTSQSLPDDLSMGTQDFISHGGYVNQRRGAPSGEVSALNGRLSSIIDPRPPGKSQQVLPSSPPSFYNSNNDSLIHQDQPIQIPSMHHQDSTAPAQDTSVVHYQENEPKLKSSGSPLKLFGNRDTYTNNKLMRILSHFDESKHSEEEQEQSVVPDQSQSALRVSHFGQGELENFNFEFQKQVSLSPQDRREVYLDGSPIFKSQPVIDPQPAATSAHANESNLPNVQSSIRSPKRRRTLLKDEINVDSQHLEIKIGQVEDTKKLAGTKRKDARPGDAGLQAEPDILASRTLLQPRMSRRSSSASKIPQLSPLSSQPQTADQQDEGVAEALAAELASFAQEAAQVQNDSRKPSLGTKDYMEEANKVMQFIRNRGKPKPALPEIEEPEDQSELDPDKILDLEIDEESTKEEFSRPPSREGPRMPSPDRRRAVHDPRTASYLRKYQEDDGLELLASTSCLGTLKMVDNRAAQEASQVPVPEDSDHDQQESSPPNMRILNHDQTQRKRKLSTSTLDEQAKVQTLGSSGESTQHTFPTTSSSGHKGMITSGTVSIPDQVGKMTYDHQQQRWIPATKPPQVNKSNTRSERTANSEADPFENIPDLSIDENTEDDAKTCSRRRALALHQQGNSAKDGTQNQSPDPDRDPAPAPYQDFSVERRRMRAESDAASKDSSLRCEVSKHEARLHDGLASRPPAPAPDDKKQPRVVTIAFSSPLVSAVQYPDDLSDLDEEVDLPLDDSELSATPPAPKQKTPRSKPKETEREPKYEHYRAMTLNRRPVSRIEESDENEDQAEMSLIRVNQPQDLTPAPKERRITKHRQSKCHNSSILCLTPLSDFTIHQADRERHPEESFVEERANPKALRQAHGSLALAIDNLVKAITDEEPSELYWERIRKMRLEDKGLTSLHGLLDYCSGLEQLSVANNQIPHLNGLPSSLRVLDMQNNALTSLASWGQLHNLQYLDVSGNQLDNLNGFSFLTHLRRLVANDNAISNIDGILDMDGLLELQLRGNNITEIDFGNTSFDRLRKLDLGSNQIRVIRNLIQLISLEELSLADNEIEQISVEEAMSVLKSLNISCNQIEIIDLGLFPALRSLNADSNKIQNVARLADAYHLDTLSMRSQSGITDLVNNILSTPNECRSICLSTNAVPGGIVSLPELPQCNVRELELAGCGISELPLAFGDLFPNCRHLNLNYNAIKEISALQGMSKLSKLEIARNRIKRMRRTCLALARLQKLSRLDMRDNPLTLGFYPPVAAEKDEVSRGMYSLAARDWERDSSWIERLDEITQLKRRTVELLLIEGCPKLKEVDGLSSGERVIYKEDVTWSRLTGKGILVKPTSSVNRHEQVVGQEGGDQRDPHSDEGIDMSCNACGAEFDD